jgi:hypothetical protein
MKQLHTVHAQPHDYGCDVGMSGIDLFLPGGGYHSLQTDMQDLRQVLRSTHCNLVRLVTPDSVRLTIIGGWPHPWHASRIILNEVAADELVRVHTRVSLLNTPAHVTEGGWSLVKEAPWVQLYGAAEDVGELVTADFSRSKAREFRAEELALPSGVYLASPCHQVLFRTDKVSGPAGEVSLV